MRTYVFVLVLCLVAVGASPIEASDSNMVLIAAGSFQMGDNYAEGNWYERPVHNVWVDAFLIDPYETTKGLWDTVHDWAILNGYGFDNAGSGSGVDYPVHTISWYDMVKWCNARSEMEGFAPCYYTDVTHTTVYRVGNLDLSNAAVDWNSNGYRLPTEAEWEKAARGGVTGDHFPWPSTGGSWTDHIDLTKTNFARNTSDSAPVGSFELPNGYGLYDMAGNIYERCWDWARRDYTTSAVSNPRGPDSGTYRMARGGAWTHGAAESRCAYRNANVPMSLALDMYGFRCVRVNRSPSADAGADQRVACESDGGAIVTLDGSGSQDPDGDEIAYSWSVSEDSGAEFVDPTIATPVGWFPLGTTLVTLAVTDGHGGMDSADVLVTVSDDQAPEMTCTTDVAALWPPNHHAVAVELLITPQDDCTDPQDLVVTCLVSSSEPDDANGDGAFTGDVNGQDAYGAPVPIVLAYAADRSAYIAHVVLRAERDGALDGRVYSFTCDVEDTAGNIGSASCVVVVPHDRRR